MGAKTQMYEYLRDKVHLLIILTTQYNYHVSDYYLMVETTS
jgi:hypothetical protein